MWQHTMEDGLLSLDSLWALTPSHLPVVTPDHQSPSAFAVQAITWPTV